ncbi:actin-like protein Arp4p [Laetiporus sulphureus 93-53]|uniref:Actin-like protein Arp4p n=1 Tax=Laetiporus sulphureus 93-53 TaxID=1314785 RepID=A0A165IEF4_9APHY|nr:actin-like protein Arp4p [Laetiporus sulphureus 93-53]KZT12962.1 actin-like protein Arp4p [Laetiporus sulphureus 93-53]
MVQYGGDEVSALVVDIGTSSVRAGYAGDDTPKAIIPTAYGFIEESSETQPEGTTGDGDVAMGEAGAGENGEAANRNPAKKKAKLYIGQNGPSMWRENMQVANPVQNGLITDFEPIPALISHALEVVMRCSPSEHPILVTEPAWNTPANRERMAEIMFEEFNVPAFYISNTGVLNAFAAGKGSAFVIDIGSSTASVAPVIDGFVMRRGLTHSALPQFVHAHAKHLLTTSSPRVGRPAIQLYSHQLIANRQPVDVGLPPKFELRQDRIAGTTESWRLWSEAKEVDEWMQSVAGVLDQGWNEQAANLRGARHYEFPTGYNFSFTGIERYSVGEYFFTHSPQLMATNPNLPKTIPALIASSLNACDVEIRQVLMGNVVLTGGGSLFSGIVDRLQNELTRQFPHAKIHAPGNPTERRFGGWLGGSILASLGTFHQLWISKEEWQEHGKAIVGQRCK